MQSRSTTFCLLGEREVPTGKIFQRFEIAGLFYCYLQCFVRPSSIVLFFFLMVLAHLSQTRVIYNVCTTPPIFVLLFTCNPRLTWLLTCFLQWFRAYYFSHPALMLKARCPRGLRPHIDRWLRFGCDSVAIWLRFEQPSHSWSAIMCLQ